MENSTAGPVRNTNSPTSSQNPSPTSFGPVGRKRPGHCGRCGAHGIKVPLAGSNHRFLCPFRSCPCARCGRIEQDAARRRARHPRLAEQVRSIVAHYSTSKQEPAESTNGRDGDDSVNSNESHVVTTPTSTLSPPSPSITSPASENIAHSGLVVAPANATREQLPVRPSNSNSNSSGTGSEKPQTPYQNELPGADVLTAAYLQSYLQWVGVLSALCTPALYLPTPLPNLTAHTDGTKKRTEQQPKQADSSRPKKPKLSSQSNDKSGHFSKTTNPNARIDRMRTRAPSERAIEEWGQNDGLTIHTTPFTHRT